MSEVIALTIDVKATVFLKWRLNKKTGKYEWMINGWHPFEIPSTNFPGETESASERDVERILHQQYDMTTLKRKDKSNGGIGKPNQGPSTKDSPKVEATAETKSQVSCSGTLSQEAKPQEGTSLPSSS